MFIAIHSRQLSTLTLPFLEQITSLAATYQKTVMISNTLAASLHASSDVGAKLPIFQLNQLNLQRDLELVISLGGDGTLLETVHYLKEHAVPLLGIHTGNLGFLTMVTHTEAISGLIRFFKGDYTLDERTLLAVHSCDGSLFFALNEVAFLKSNQLNLLTIDGYINDQFITTYRADGLIIATPTGSTAYSLSCSGPIVLPSSKSLVINPISPHNLALRPLVVPETALLSFEARSLDKDMLVALDGRLTPMSTQNPILVQKAPFSLQLVQFGQATVFDVLREKFYWGLDGRVE